MRVVLVAVGGEAVAVVGRRVDTGVGLGREGRVGEADLLEAAAELERVAVGLGRVGAGAQVQRLAGVKYCRVLGLLGLAVGVVVGVDVDGGPAVVTGGAEGTAR